MSFLKQFKGGYQDLWKTIIRPPRDEYIISDLGPKQFSLGGKLCQRTDLKIVNKRGLKLECSHFEPVKRVADQLPCVIFLHGNCSSRIEALPIVEQLLPSNITVFCFDFSGCGLSEGEYISLGWYERDDVAAVVEYLRKTEKVSAIGLWGRSMGAVTALMHADRDPSIAGMVLDSPFSSLRLLAEEMCTNHTKIPKFILSGALSLIKGTIQTKANFNINDLVPMNHVASGFIPAFFVAGKQDAFIDPHHAKDLYDKYAGDKNIVFVEGDHNSPRPQFLMDSITIFFYNTLYCDLLPQQDKNSSNIKNNEELKGPGLNESYLKHNAQIGKKIGNDSEVSQLLEDLSEEELLKLALEESLKFQDNSNNNNNDNNNNSKGQKNSDGVANIENPDDVEIVDYADKEEKKQDS